MKIDGNYHSNYYSYPETGHNHATHTHHFTEHLHEEGSSQKMEGAYMAADGVTLEIRGIGDAMSDEAGQKQDMPVMDDREDISFRKRVFQGVNAVVSAIKQSFTFQVTGRFHTVREKLKVGIHTALKRFGKDREAFGTLTDPGTGSLLGGKTGGEAGRNKNSAGTTQEKNESIKAAQMKNEHLMDSYSKSGTYCKINENLTYQQGRAPYKVSSRTEQPR